MRHEQANGHAGERAGQASRCRNSADQAGHSCCTWSRYAGGAIEPASRGRASAATCSTTSSAPASRASSAAGPSAPLTDGLPSCAASTRLSVQSLEIRAGSTSTTGQAPPRITASAAAPTTPAGRTSAVWAHMTISVAPQSAAAARIASAGLRRGPPAWRRCRSAGCSPSDSADLLAAPPPRSRAGDASAPSAARPGAWRWAARRGRASIHPAGPARPGGHCAISCAGAGGACAEALSG